MKKMAFISRHEPTETQFSLAKKAGFELIPVGDIDAFTGDIPNEYDAICVVNPALALRALKFYNVVGVFENELRAKEGEKPTFSARALHLFKVESVEVSGYTNGFTPEVCVETIR